MPGPRETGNRGKKTRSAGTTQSKGAFILIRKQDTHRGRHRSVLKFFTTL